MNIIFLGAPGSGKGTQSALLVEKHHLTHLSTGDMLRAEIAKGSDLGQKAKAVMDKGELVSDDIVIAMIAEHLENVQGVLFDGFPRTLSQAKALDDLLAAKGLPITHVIELKVDSEEIISRLLSRGRADDNEETIRNRLQVFENQTKPLVDYYTTQGKLHSVVGVGSVDEIHAQIERHLA
ncbi:MAG: adenylate kinase [Cardiobacteriaceae bacterium]|nr:adenylate kinase [Cardiobacteriaceae bacterium]